MMTEGEERERRYTHEDAVRYRERIHELAVRADRARASCLQETIENEWHRRWEAEACRDVRETVGGTWSIVDARRAHLVLQKIRAVQRRVGMKRPGWAYGKGYRIWRYLLGVLGALLALLDAVLGKQKYNYPFKGKGSVTPFPESSEEKVEAIVPYITEDMKIPCWVISPFLDYDYGTFPIYEKKRMVQIGQMEEALWEEIDRCLGDGEGSVTVEFQQVPLYEVMDLDCGDEYYANLYMDDLIEEFGEEKCRKADLLRWSGDRFFEENFRS